jgi:signal transduction histidine kinase
LQAFQTSSPGSRIRSFEVMCMRYLFIILCLAPFVAFSQQAEIARLKNAPESGKIQIYKEISRAYAAGQPDSAIHYTQEGMRLAEKRNDQQGLASLLLEAGRINALHQHRELSRKFYNEALGIFRRLQDSEGIAQAYDALGLLDGVEENISSATRDLAQAMKYYKDSRDSTGILETYEGLGRVYEEKGNSEKALSYYLRTLALYEQHKLKPEAYFVLLEQIGNFYLKKGDHQSALRYLQEGIHNSSQAGLRDTEINLLDEEGKVYQSEGLSLKALQTYKQALAEAKKYRQPEEQAHALINIAGLLKKQNAGASLIDLKMAMNIAQNLQQPQLKARIYEAMAGIYRQEKNYKEAMDALEEQHHLLDSLLQADTAKDIAALDSSYALESSLQKIGHLQKVNRSEEGTIQVGLAILIAVVIVLALLWLYLRKIKKLNNELNASNRVKDTLFSVIGHDLKGPAGSAAQLFELMETEDFSEKEMRGMIADLRKQTTASVELLHALFEWGKAQLQGVRVNLVDFDPKPVIDRCISLLSQQATQKNISLMFNLPGYAYIHADADHFELIIRNLLSNAIKFSHEGSTVEVKAQSCSSKKEVVFSVHDSGIGISKLQQEIFLTGNLNVSFGTRKEKGSGLGLLLVKDFIKANNGRLWLESQDVEGTTFYVALPAA